MQRPALRLYDYAAPTDAGVGRWRPQAAMTWNGRMLASPPALGLYVSDPTPESTAMETLLKRPLDCVLAFGDANVSSSTWFMDATTHWKGNRKVVVSIPLSVAGWDLAVAAAGGFNATYQTAVDNLQPWLSRIISVRIGWEFNAGGAFPWTAGGAGTNQTPANYVAAFRQLAGKIRNDCPGVLIDWCPLWDQPVADVWYPGDDYVDIIGCDVYLNSAFWPDTFASVLGAPCGLTWLEGFANAHSKFMSLPEWATNYNTGTFVTRMAAWMQRPRPNPVLYQNYWNSDSAFVSKLSNKLVNQAAYVAAFGMP